MSGEAELVNDVSVQLVDEVNSAQYDALVVLLGPELPPPQAIEDFLAALAAVDASTEKRTGVVPCARVSGGRLVLAHLEPPSQYDDVRAVGEAAGAGLRRARAAGAQRPALALAPHARWRRAPLVALLGALEALHVPLQARERGAPPAARALGVYAEGLGDARALVRAACGLERARGPARDIGGADPERMCPARVAQYVRDLFRGSAVRVRVVDDRETLRREYPLLAAVDRGAADRHRGCVIFLEYEPESYERTVMLVGKGVTYDTGGCDVKVDGAMCGMSRDKCGAAACVGFLAACVELRARIKAVAALGVVRNSVGADAYVADELLVSRGGRTVRVGNTDAEGRLVMADLLHELAERAAAERAPHLYTVATLTGHAVRAYGAGYTAALDNHVARASGHAHKLAAGGAALGDMLEVGTLRREDLAAHRGRAPGDELLQAAPAPSTRQPRGHQAPAAFLLLAGALDTGAVPYTHLDVAASAGDLPAPPTAAPLLALAQHYGLLDLVH